MAETGKKVEVRYGAFACTIEGYDNPVEQLNKILGEMRHFIAATPQVGAGAEAMKIQEALDPNSEDEEASAGIIVIRDTAPTREDASEDGDTSTARDVEEAVEVSETPDDTTVAAAERVPDAGDGDVVDDSGLEADLADAFVAGEPDDSIQDEASSEDQGSSDGWVADVGAVAGMAAAGAAAASFAQDDVEDVGSTEELADDREVAAMNEPESPDVISSDAAAGAADPWDGGAEAPAYPESADGTDSEAAADSDPIKFSTDAAVAEAETAADFEAEPEPETIYEPVAEFEPAAVDEPEPETTPEAADDTRPTPDIFSSAGDGDSGSAEVAPASEESPEATEDEAVDDGVNIFAASDDADEVPPPADAETAEAEAEAEAETAESETQPAETENIFAATPSEPEPEVDDVDVPEVGETEAPGENIFAASSEETPEPVEAEEVESVPAESTNIFAAPSEPVAPTAAEAPDDSTNIFATPSELAAPSEPVAPAAAAAETSESSTNIFAAPSEPTVPAAAKAPKENTNIFAASSEPEAPAAVEAPEESTNIFAAPSEPAVPAAAKAPEENTNIFAASSEPEGPAAVEAPEESTNIFASPSEPTVHAAAEALDDSTNIFAASSEPTAPAAAEESTNIFAATSEPVAPAPAETPENNANIFAAPTEPAAATFAPVEENPDIFASSTGDEHTLRATRDADVPDMPQSGMWDTATEALSAATPETVHRTLDDLGDRVASLNGTQPPVDPEPITEPSGSYSGFTQSPDAGVDAEPQEPVVQEETPTSRLKSLLNRYQSSDSSTSDSAEAQADPAVEADDGMASGINSAADLAARAGSESVPDLLAASAAWLTLEKGKSRFSRRDVMDIFDQIPGDHPKTLEARIKGYGRLVRSGMLVLVDDGVFTMAQAERERFQTILDRY